jgi:hypothetical protein
MVTSQNGSNAEVSFSAANGHRRAARNLSPECRGDLLRIAADVRRLAGEHPRDDKVLKSLAALMEAVAQ